MSTPELKPMNTIDPEFGAWLQGHLRCQDQITSTPDFALKSGACVFTLVHYAAGSCNESERKAVENYLCRLSWCMEVITTLVKSSRNPDNKNTHRLLRLSRDGQLEQSIPEEELIADLTELTSYSSNDRHRRDSA